MRIKIKNRGTALIVGKGKNVFDSLWFEIETRGHKKVMFLNKKQIKRLIKGLDILEKKLK